MFITFISIHGIKYLVLRDHVRLIKTIKHPVSEWLISVYGWDEAIPVTEKQFKKILKCFSGVVVDG